MNIFSLDQERKHEVKEGEKEGASEDEELSLKVGFNSISRVAELPFLQIKCELCCKAFASQNSVRKHKRNFHKIRTFGSEVGIMTQ